MRLTGQARTTDRAPLSASPDIVAYPSMMDIIGTSKLEMLINTLTVTSISPILP
jgi:hypothetical protein